MVRHRFVYVDESFVPRHDLLVAGLVFSPFDLSEDVNEILLRHGFAPGTDEFKSTANFRDEPRWGAVRDSLLDLLLKRECELAATIASHSVDLRLLGNHVLDTVLSVAGHAGFEASPLSIYLDRDLKRDEQRLRAQIPDTAHVDRPRMVFGCDSRLVGGIQLADMIAGALRTVFVQQLEGNKAVVVFGEAEGYPQETEIQLSEEILMHLAWRFFADPLPPDEHGNQLIWTALPKGAFFSSNVKGPLRAAASARLGSLWRGCAH